VYEHVFLSVVPVDESVARLHVKPLDGATHFSGNHLLFWLLLLISSLLLGGRLALRFSHVDGVVLIVLVTCLLM